MTELIAKGILALAGCCWCFERMRKPSEKNYLLARNPRVKAWRRLSTIIADLLCEGVFLNGLVVDCVTSELFSWKSFAAGRAHAGFSPHSTMMYPSSYLSSCHGLFLCFSWMFVHDPYRAQQLVLALYDDVVGASTLCIRNTH